MKIITPLLCAVLALGALSCKKEEAAPAFDVDAMRTCFLRGSSDSLFVARSLLGQWDWVYARCSFVPATGTDTLYQGLRVEFRADGTLTVHQEGQPAQIVDWQLQNLGSKAYQLRTEPWVTQVGGFVYVCGDQAVFNNTPLDGCDNYYRRGE